MKTKKDWFKHYVLQLEADRSKIRDDGLTRDEIEVTTFDKVRRATACTRVQARKEITLRCWRKG